jgi:abhydrolase domain-containing protein 11
LAYTKFEPNSSKATSKPVVDHPILILHGLFGSKTNWQSIAKALRDKLRQTVITVDARNHGESPHDSDHSYEGMSDDLEELLEKLNIPRAVFLGHSMVRSRPFSPKTKFLSFFSSDRVEKQPCVWRFGKRFVHL